MIASQIHTRNTERLQVRTAEAANSLINGNTTVPSDHKVIITAPSQRPTTCTPTKAHYRRTHSTTTHSHHRTSLAEAPSPKATQASAWGSEGG
jgi:hypothetical protein